MDREQMIRELTTLTEHEQAAHYIYAHRLDSQEALCAHARQIRAFFSSESEYQKLIRQYEGGIPYMLAGMNFPKGQRLGLFIHPRFSNNTMHSHDYCEVKYVLQGSARMNAAGSTFTLTSGDLCIISPNCPHQTLVFDQDTLIVNAEFSPEAMGDLFPRLFKTPNTISGFLSPHASADPAQGQIMRFPQIPDAVGERIVSALYAEKNSANSPFAMLLCESYIEQAFLLLLERQPDVYKTDIAQSRLDDISEILSYINKHLADIRFSDLAAAFHYNESYLSGYIKKYTGYSFQRIVRVCRLDEAARLLTATDCPVEQIMRQIGYSAKTHFFRAFKERFGKTPAEYRAAVR